MQPTSSSTESIGSIDNNPAPTLYLGPVQAGKTRRVIQDALESCNGDTSLCLAFKASMIAIGGHPSSKFCHYEPGLDAGGIVWFSVTTSSELLRIAGRSEFDKVTTIIIDEAHFLEDLKSCVSALWFDDKHVFIAGLTSNLWGETWAPISSLLAICCIRHCHAVCTRCGSPHGTMSYQVREASEQDPMESVYSPVCYSCWRLLYTKVSAPRKNINSPTSNRSRSSTSSSTSTSPISCSSSMSPVLVRRRSDVVTTTTTTTTTAPTTPREIVGEVVAIPIFMDE